LGARAVISADYDVIKSADKLILPGVGHFDRAMDNIINKKLLDLLTEMALVKRLVKLRKPKFIRIDYRSRN
jgi:glutamine amidotransferase